jgi:hypothetical protein
MNKTPITVALERQIPEYVRGEYELFVKFIKAYYEFLDQTQQRNLEDIRSIENTLEEFVIRFKKELSVLFPTNTLANERFILQRIREFYQSRGSKESYQFLFRILFNKDSEVFYPSTQILRASDGKWIQEKSVFVEIKSGDMFNLTGKIITIETQHKHVYVFSPRVVYYRNNVYEVFIDRAYVQDISIGDVVRSEDGSDLGNIIPCPNKYTITTEGAGFEVGQLFYLKTNSGDGSLIKVTKIGTGGSIKKIQIISFGLDYESTYYAKLSNKQAVAVPYLHPVPGPYPDGINGFVDFGYINKQDYFYFDEFYQPTVANNQNVFYADGTYVGDIIASFYTNASNTNVIDNDTAEIKIELGAVATYPGYYAASDGFISDESYIQDGKYYQLFSYVIRVEQQIDSYIEIVKQLLHPAGMELYAEYNIKNDYLVSASPLLAFIRRQFLEQEFVTDDEGTNEVYKVESDSIESIHTDRQDIKDVIAPKADSVSQPDFNYYDDDKVISLLDSIVNSLDDRFNDIHQLKSDDISTTENVIDAFTLGVVAEFIIPVESGKNWQFSGNTWKDNVSAIDDNVIPEKLPYYMDAIYLSPYYSGGVQYGDADVFNQTVTYYRVGTDTVSTEESGKTWGWSGNTFNQYVSSVDGVPIRSKNKLLSETINNTNTGSLYFNAYSQDSSDPLSTYSYEAETYSEHTIRAIS